ncbi:hypothetical protein ACC771_07100, partial [Rhizobium ruizarguesonis]
MAINENFPGVPADRRVAKGRSSLHPLHEAAMRLAEIGLQRPKAKSPKTRDLINLLLCQARAPWH